MSGISIASHFYKLIVTSNISIISFNIYKSKLLLYSYHEIITVNCNNWIQD